MKRLLAGLVVMALVSHAMAKENWKGLYRTDSGQFVGVAEFHEFGPAEILVNYETGEAGVLIPQENGRVGIGAAIGDLKSPPVHWLEKKDGKSFFDRSRLTSIPLQRRGFSVERNGVTLAGEVDRLSDSLKGVLVFGHGSGDAPREAYELWSNFFVSRGWAVVVFDKRGSGKSTGDWHTTDFQTLAGDLRAVAEWSRGQREFDGLPFGLWGVSQAGWIIPQIAAEPLVNFAIVQAGAITPVDEFVGETLESELKAYGFSADEIAKARSYYDLDFAVSCGRRGIGEVERAYREATAAGAEWLLKPPDSVDAPDRKFMATIAGFDAAPYWRRVAIPMLILFGDKDHVVPAASNRPRMEKLLAQAGNKQTQIVTLQDDNHLNLLAKTGVRTEYPSLNRFDPEYFRILTKFLQQR